MDAFRDGANVSQALLLAKVDKNTYYRHLKDVIFRDKMNYAQNEVLIKAKQNVKKSIDDGSIDNSKWLLGIKEPEEYAPNSDINAKTVNIIGYIDKREIKQLENKPNNTIIDADSEIIEP